MPYEGTREETRVQQTKTARHIQPKCHSICEQNPAKEQLEREETILSQILI